MQRIAAAAAADRAMQPSATDHAAAARNAYTHWVQLIEGWTANAVAYNGQDAASSSTRSLRTCVCLAIAPLYQSAAFVLHYQQGRRRHGLPLEAVRGMAQQTLQALHALHR